MSKLSELKKQFEDIEKKIQVEGKAAFQEAAQAIFTKYPKLNTFGWTQYTPFFNDGDECVFSVHSDYPYINEYHYDYDEEDLQGLTEEEAKNIREEVSEILQSIPEDAMKAIFGNHVHVTVSRDGSIETESYDHD